MGTEQGCGEGQPSGAACGWTELPARALGVPRSCAPDEQRGVAIERCRSSLQPSGLLLCLSQPSGTAWTSGWDPMLPGPLPAVLTFHRLQSHLPPPLSLQLPPPFIFSPGSASLCMPPAEFQGLGLSTVGHSSLLFSPEPSQALAKIWSQPYPQGSLAGIRQSLLGVGLEGQAQSVGRGLTFVKYLS